MTRVSYATAERARNSTIADEMAREAEAVIRKALAEFTAAALADAAGVSPSTVSRWTGEERLTDLMRLLYHLGFRVYPADWKVLEPSKYDFLVETAITALQQVPSLVLGVKT